MIGNRLKDERKRLKKSQAEFGSLADGASKRTVVDWESGKTSPTAVQLSALSNAGVDILYVVTGQRAFTEVTDDKKLAPDEKDLLDNYRRSSPEGRAALKSTSDALAIRGVKKVI